jgi:hypothetical protein
MGRAAMLAAGLFLFSANLAWAQELPANSLPEGTFATEDGCKKLAAKTPAELGEDLDFEILTKKGLLANQQACDFVNVYTHDATSWVATSFCDEGGYTYPDLFSIKQKDDGRLDVTRFTDLTDQGSKGSSTESDTEDSESSNEPPKASGDGKSGQAAPEDEQAAESNSTFAKCQNVKP